MRLAAGVRSTTFKTRRHMRVPSSTRHTPYHYSTYEEDRRGAARSSGSGMIILGSGPNRIGQGIEFDYCCVHASLRPEATQGYETVMVNCNPETVSTDYDTSDRLFFEPLTFEHVLGIIDREKPEGVIVQFGGQTPLKLAVPLEREGVPIIGTPPDAIDRAEDRERFRRPARSSLGLKPAAIGQHRRRPFRPSRRYRRGNRWAIRCWCGPPTCWAAARWMIVRRRRASLGALHAIGPGRGRRESGSAQHSHRQVHPRTPSRWTWTPWAMAKQVDHRLA